MIAPTLPRRACVKQRMAFKQHVILRFERRVEVWHKTNPEERVIILSLCPVVSKVETLRVTSAGLMKTTITERATYVSRVFPFGIKN